MGSSEVKYQAAQAGLPESVFLGLYVREIPVWSDLLPFNDTAEPSANK
jgi:hypothetical protein